MIDSHSELVEYFKLPDSTMGHQHFAKVELTPTSDKDEDWFDPTTWAFRLDEEQAPGWWEDVCVTAEARMRQRAHAMILRDDETHPLIVDGCWIIGGTSKIREVRSGRIVRLCGGTVSAIRGGTVSAIRGGTVSAICGGTVSEIRGGTVSEIRGGTVSEIWGGTVSAIRGGTVSEIKSSPFYTLNLSDTAKAELVRRGVLKADTPKKTTTRKTKKKAVK